MATTRHAQHDRICAEVRSWYRTSAPKVGYEIERRRLGFYRRNTANPDAARIIVEGVLPTDVPALLADARGYFGDREVEIWIDDHEADALLGPALLGAGCSGVRTVIYLAHVGPIPDAPPSGGVAIEPVGAALLDEFVAAKLKGFANSEDGPAPEWFAKERAVREAELRGPGRFFIARVGREAAAILGYYEGTDRLIFNLATRLPFRNRGLARFLLSGAIADAQQTGCRSVIINTNPVDTPINWYRRLGFTDEVYWHRTYQYGLVG